MRVHSSLKTLASFSLLLLFPVDAFSSNASEWANGSWGWVPQGQNKEVLEDLTCTADALSIQIDFKAHRYHASEKDGLPIVGDILSVGEDFIVLQYDNEERLMENGEPHIWAMVFQHPDEFVWVRYDWINDRGEILGSTAPLRRCEISLA